MAAKAPAIMVTGSHIPADRNGLKFYLADGEVSKTDEAAINAAYAEKTRYEGAGAGTYRKAPEAEKLYIARYVDAFGEDALAGLKIGVYRHSSVARDTMEAIFKGLGAAIIPLAHSDTFIPVDTEAVDVETSDKLRAWCLDNGLDAIASTDLTDGLRVDFDSGDVLHLRPSGNAPEFRIYAQSSSEAKAVELVKTAFKSVAEQVL